jgi:hypothetical protein
MRLSLVLGVRASQIGKILTSREWAEYQAADAAGLIPDHGFYRDAILAMAGRRDEEPQDLMTGYRQRKAMYGGQAGKRRGVSG